MPYEAQFTGCAALIAGAAWNTGTVLVSDGGFSL